MGEIVKDLPERLFVTGTDTGVGKTLICAALMVSFDNVYYWKPVQTGSEEGTDTEWIRNVTGLPSERFIPEAYCLKKPLSPHAAAELEGITLDPFAIVPPVVNGRLIVEGAGGVMVPLNSHYFMLDLMKFFGFPVLVVSRSTLGTINHTLLTLMALRNAGLDVAGVVLNGPLNESNKKAIEHFGKVSVVAQVEPLDTIKLDTLRKAIMK
ncbi:MAG: dethiobiotin synthase [Thermodesulforhabdaceae bacterium]